MFAANKKVFPYIRESSPLGTAKTGVITLQNVHPNMPRGRHFPIDTDNFAHVYINISVFSHEMTHIEKLKWHVQEAGKKAERYC